jgi:hypothetical protein
LTHINLRNTGEGALSRRFPVKIGKECQFRAANVAEQQKRTQLGRISAMISISQKARKGRVEALANRTSGQGRLDLIGGQAGRNRAAQFPGTTVNRRPDAMPIWAV